jgi:hypothetical protein
MPKRPLHELSQAFVLFAVALGTVTAAAQGGLSSSLARYEIRRGDHVERLEVVRTQERVEHRYATRGMTEIWSRDGRGELSHWKVFHKAGRSVHYTAGDLRTIQVEPSWEKLATLINPDERAHLKSRGTRRTESGTLSVLEGLIDQQRARVLWNEQTSWAQEIVIGAQGDKTRFRLLSSEACSASACAPLDTAEVREIEFADLGDSENDPFVRSFLASFAHGHAH